MTPHSARAPLLAVWRRGHLAVVAGSAAAGYAGDIVAIGTSFVVSAPRAGRVDAWNDVGGWQPAAAGADACALAVDAAGCVWSARDGAIEAIDAIDAVESWGHSNFGRRNARLPGVPFGLSLSKPNAKGTFDSSEGTGSSSRGPAR